MIKLKGAAKMFSSKKVGLRTSYVENDYSTVGAYLRARKIPKHQKKTKDLTAFFCTFGIIAYKSCTVNVGEIDPRGGQLFLAHGPH